MPIRKEIFLFNKEIRAFPHWKSKFNNLMGVWYDGTSGMIDGLFEILSPEVIILEECLLETVSQRLSKSLLSRVLIQEGSEALSVTSKNQNLETSPFCIFPSNDTHVYLFKNVLAELRPFEVWLSPYKRRNEDAYKALEQINLPYKIAQISQKDIHRFKGLMMGNDWGLIELYTLRQFQKHQLPTVCLQESVINFKDSNRRMQWCDYPFIQGMLTFKSLERDIIFLTGNPRYEELAPQPKSGQDFVLINSNFTYGVYEDVRDQWIMDVVEASANNGMNYIISQHPRDTGNLSQYHHVRSNASKIHDLLRSCSVTVTRFSSLIHESLALGRPVVYYNPHNEEMHYDFEPDHQHLFLVTSKEELVRVLARLRIHETQDPRQDPFYKKYGMRHYGAADGKASSRVLQALKVVNKPSVDVAVASYPQIRLHLRYYRERVLRTAERLFTYHSGLVS